MHIAVLMRGVLDVEGPVRIDRPKNDIKRGGLAYFTNPLDRIAVEQAFQIKREVDDTTITAIVVGDHRDKVILHDALSLGADKGVLIRDDFSDRRSPSGTAEKFVSALGLNFPEIVVCGQRVDDSEDEETGAYIADLLSYPLVSHALSIDVSDNGRTMDITRKLLRGDREIVEVSTPAVVTMETGMIQARYPSVRERIKSKEKPIKIIETVVSENSEDSLQVHPDHPVPITGYSPPKPKTQNVFSPDKKLSGAQRLSMAMSGGLVQKKSKKMEGGSTEIAENLVHFLCEKKILKT